MSAKERAGWSRCIAAMISFTVGLAQVAAAGEWCTVSGFGVSENNGSTSVHGTISGSSGSIYQEWLLLERTESPEIGKKRLAMALAAVMAGKDLQIYISSHTCTTLPNWQSDLILHLRVQ